MAIKITYYVHATTTDNLNKICTGQLDGELSEKGINQCYELQKHIDKKKFDILFSSDLKRAVDSAKIDFLNTGLKINLDKRLRECDYGDLNGKDDKLVVYEDHIQEPFENGENLIQVEKRIRDFLLYLVENYDNKHIAIVSHKAPQLAIEKIVYNKTWEKTLADDWRKTKSWQPGWEYTIDKDMLIQNDNFDCHLAVERVTKIIKKYYDMSSPVENVDRKEQNDIVTNVDLFMEENIIKELSKFYPTHSFYAEEGGEREVTQNGKDFYEWIIDPIDGTVNFAAGLPDFGIVVGLQKNGETLLGVTVLPKLNEVYTAIKGEGAFCNGKQMKVSENKDLSNCIVMIYSGSNYESKTISQNAKLFEKLTHLARGVRIVGSSASASCYLANGKVDAIINLKPSMSLGSTVGRLCTLEAGGMVTNTMGTKRKRVDTMVCSNGKIHQEILDIISSCIN